MQTCGKMITCWDYLKRPCQRVAGHTPNLCNPFGPDHPWDNDRAVRNTDDLYHQVLRAANLEKVRVAA